MALIVKGTRLQFFMVDGRVIRLSPGYGFIHDPEGEHFNKCEVFCGRVNRTQRAPAKKNAKADRYFGPKYKQREATVSIPKGPWDDLGNVAEIRYTRLGQYAGNYFHKFKSKPPTLSKCKGYFRLWLHNGCIVDDRGFVFP